MRVRQAKRAAEPLSFASFWAIYPRKVARVAAVKAWIKIDPTSELIQLIQSALIAQRPGMLAREPDKIPHAATWLRGKRWEDEAAAFGTAHPPRTNGHSSVTPGKDYSAGMDLFKKGSP